VLCSPVPGVDRSTVLWYIRVMTQTQAQPNWTVHYVDETGAYSAEIYATMADAEQALAELAGEPGERWATLGRGNR
jgi:hypothetical protein